MFTNNFNTSDTVFSLTSHGLDSVSCLASLPDHHLGLLVCLCACFNCLFALTDHVSDFDLSD